MADEIKAALTAEEWETHQKVYFRQPRYYECSRWICQCHSDPSRRHAEDEGYGVELTKDADMAVWDGSWGVTVNKTNRHALAALALHGQPFGFTREMVNGLIDLANLVDPDDIEELVANAKNVAARIEALLPPE